jgi:hypothetical protein
MMGFSDASREIESDHDFEPPQIYFKNIMK